MAVNNEEKNEKNCYGDIITGIKQFQDPSFGHYEPDGKEVVHWKKPDDLVDEDGFDKTYNDGFGNYKKVITLPYGKVICRYGNWMGRLTTDIDSDYEQLGLPYIKETVEYHVYRVIADGLKVKCSVNKGIVAPMFNSRGGAIQYKHFQSIKQELDQHKIEEVYL